MSGLERAAPRCGSDKFTVRRPLQSANPLGQHCLWLSNMLNLNVY
jgi:hypothetical protein